jgi:outer membrane lipoprotein-sorting protein
MKNIFTLLVTALFAISAIAQSDPAAEQILDRVSEKTRSYDYISIEFTYSIENPQSGLPQNTVDGSLIIGGNKYRVELMGNIQMSNGQRIWRVIEDDMVIETMSANMNEDEGLSPDKILTMYEEGYKVRLMEKRVIDGVELQVIRLYPENVKEVPYTHIDVMVDTKKNQLVRIVETGKNGTITTYSINSFNTNVTVDSFTFELDKKKYADFEIIELDF